MAHKPKFLNVSKEHELFRQDIAGAVATFQKLPPLERLAVIAIFLGQQIALCEGYDRKNVMDMVAANLHFGATHAVNARKIISF